MGKKERKVVGVTAVLLQLWKKNGCSSEGDGVSDTGSRGEARTEIEIEEEINKGNPFSPDIGFHTDIVLLSGSIHLRHNAPVSSAHTTFTLNKRYSL